MRVSDHDSDAGEASSFAVSSPRRGSCRRSSVRLQTYATAAGRTSPAPGETKSDGRYRMRVILSVRGVRDLRVVGSSADGHDQRFHRFVVAGALKADGVARKCDLPLLG